MASLRTWFKATQPRSFVASLVGVALGTAIAWDHRRTFDLAGLVLAAIGVVCLHAGTNMSNDSIDFQRGVDDLPPHLVSPFTGGARVLVSPGERDAGARDGSARREAHDSRTHRSREVGSAVRDPGRFGARLPGGPVDPTDRPMDRGPRPRRGAPPPPRDCHPPIALPGVSGSYSCECGDDPGGAPSRRGHDGGVPGRGPSGPIDRG